jgi:hypothetical protein
VVALALTAVFEPAGEAIRSRTQAKRLLYERAVEDVLRTGLLRIAKAVHLSVDQLEGLSIHVFFVKERPWPRIWRPELFRAARFRLAPRRRSRKISWTKGKGVIGICWASEEGVPFDVSALAQEALAEGKAWDQRPPVERLNIHMMTL